MVQVRPPTFLTRLLAGVVLMIAWPAAAQHNHTASPATTSPSPSSQNTLPLTLVSASVVAVPPTIKETSAYVTVKNNGAQAIKLTGVSMSVAGHVMFMKTIKSQNMLGMVETPGFNIPARSTLSMGPDGNHLMLMKLKRPLKVGEVLQITLQASDGRSVTVKATVKKP